MAQPRRDVDSPDTAHSAIVTDHTYTPKEGEFDWGLCQVPNPEHATGICGLGRAAHGGPVDDAAAGRLQELEDVSLTPDDDREEVVPEKCDDSGEDTVNEDDGEDDGTFLTRLGTDAQKWAEECAKLVGIRMEGAEYDNLIEILTGWFANAIGAGESHGHRQYVEEFLKKEHRMSEGKQRVDGERYEQHGDPVPNMEAIGRLWAELFGTTITGHQVALAMILFKVVRSSRNPLLQDNYTDIEGYVEIARRCAGEGE